MATGNRDFSAKKQRAAQNLRVKDVAAGARTSVRQAGQKQKERWFRRPCLAMPAVSCHQRLEAALLDVPATTQTDAGFQCSVGWCVISKNLFSITHYRETQEGAIAGAIGSAAQRRKLLGEIRV